MKIKKAFTGMFLSFFACSLANIPNAKADGMLVSPPSLPMYETEQKAVIFHEDGIEDLFVSISFNGTAEDFGWILPTPTEPEVVKSTDMLFENLDKMTSPEIPTQSMGMGWDNATMEKAVDSGVQVLQTKKVEYYDISVLKADNDDALYNWLNDNGYRMPQAGKYIIDEYIENDWVFTAIKIADDRVGNSGITNQFKSGHAVPLRLTFKTEQAVFPMKITSIGGMEDDAPDGEVAFVTGAEGKGMMLDSGKIVASDRVISDFNPDNGNVSFQLKKRTDGVLGEILRVEQAKAYLGQHQGIKVQNTRNNVYSFEIWRNRGQHQTAQVDLGSDFKQNEWQSFEFNWKQNETDSKKVDIEFSIDGVNRTLNTNGYGLNSLRANELYEKAKITIGGSENYQDSNGEISTYKIQRDRVSGEVGYVPPEPTFNYFATRSSDVLIDELKINSDQQVIFEAKFEDEMKVELANDQVDVIRVFEGLGGNRNSTMLRPESMGILIYMFSEKKNTIPGFDLEFAEPISKESIQNIARIDGKTPWITPKKDKYFLTRMYKQMYVSQMNEDIYPVESESQEQFNGVSGDSNKMIFLVALLVVSFGSVGVMIFKVVQSERKTSTKDVKMKVMGNNKSKE